MDILAWTKRIEILFESTNVYAFDLENSLRRGTHGRRKNNNYGGDCSKANEILSHPDGDSECGPRDGQILDVFCIKA